MSSNPTNGASNPTRGLIDSILAEGFANFLGSLPDSRGSLAAAFILSMAQRLEEYISPACSICALIARRAKTECPKMKPRFIQIALQGTRYINTTRQASGRKGATVTNSKRQRAQPRARIQVASGTSPIVSGFAANIAANLGTCFRFEAISGAVYTETIGSYCPTAADHAARITREILPTIPKERFDEVRALINQSGVTYFSLSIDKDGNAVDLMNDFGPSSPSSGTTSI